MKRISIFLIMVALIVGTVSCAGDGGGGGGGGGGPYTLTVEVSPGGSGNATDLTGGSPYAAGTVVSIQAVANPGYHFVNWTGDVGTIANVNAAATNITMNSDYSITANFVAVLYDLTMAVAGGNGTATDLTDASPYAAGTVVSIQTVADPGYRFVNWTAPAGAFGNQTAATTNFTMPAQNVTVTANFVAVYNLTISSTAGGNVTLPGEGTFNYSYGTAVNLVATPDPGYHFVNWTGDVSTMDDEGAPATFIQMLGHYSITANFALFAGGSGTEGDPYQIADWWCLDNSRNYLSSHFIVINDLNSTTAGYTELANSTANGGKGWQPIGTLNNTFNGTFNGQGYEICDLFIDRTDEFYVGLFGFAGGSGVIENIGVVNANVIGYVYVGGLVGYNYLGRVNNSYNGYSTGGVLGGYYVGGLVGYNQEGNVSNSYSICDVSGSDVGGLVGYNNGQVSNSYSTGYVFGSTSGAGGLVGYNDLGMISNSYSTGTVYGDWYVGGLVGYNDHSTVSDSYSTGWVSGGDWTGGLVGFNDHSTVSRSYSAAYVAGHTYVGGLVGYSSVGTVIASFWDTQTSGQGSSAGGTGKNTTEMKDVDTFTGAGWDIVAVANSSTRNITYIWNIVNTVTYPFLSWEPV